MVTPAGAARVSWRRSARADFRGIILHYRETAGAPVAKEFVKIVLRSVEMLAETPGLGATRYAERVGMPGLRAWPMRKYPYLLFYLPRQDGMELIRILHTMRDLPEELRR